MMADHQHHWHSTWKPCRPVTTKIIMAAPVQNYDQYAHWYSQHCTTTNHRDPRSNQRTCKERQPSTPRQTLQPTRTPTSPGSNQPTNTSKQNLLGNNQADHREGDGDMIAEHGTAMRSISRLPTPRGTPSVMSSSRSSKDPLEDLQESPGGHLPEAPRELAKDRLSQDTR